MNYFIVDAFTDKPFGGNPAGVVLLDSDSFPKEELMLKIAAELRYSETAFVRRDGYPAHVRDFAPLYDIPEESATGTANASLTYYLQQNGYLGTEAECAFIQGEAMGRPSVIATRINPDGDIFVGGTAAIVAEGSFFYIFAEDFQPQS